MDKRRFVVSGDVQSVSRGEHSYPVVSGVVDLPASEDWYWPLVEAGVLQFAPAEAPAEEDAPKADADAEGKSNSQASDAQPAQKDAPVSDEQPKAPAKARKAAK